MQHLLFISPVFPNPEGAGREKRAYNWVCSLSKTHRVHLLVIGGQTDAMPAATPAAMPAAMPAAKPTDGLPIEDFHSISIDEAPSQDLKVMLRWLLTMGLSERSKYPSFWTTFLAEHAEQMNAWYGATPLERIVCFRLYLSDFAGHAASAFTSASASGMGEVDLDIDDLESDTWAKIAKTMVRNGDYVQSLKYWITGRQFRKMEARYLRRFSRVFVCAGEDRTKLVKRFPGMKVEVFPNRIRWEKDRAKTESVESAASAERAERVETPASPERDSSLILFVGTLGYYPNADAIRFFAGRVMPLVVRANDSAKFSIVGYGDSSALRRLLSGSAGVVWTGAVERLGPHYRKAGMVVAPLRAGGGTKIKVIEAMLHRCPLVASGEAVGGLGLLRDVHYLHAETAEEFASQCLRLMRDPELAEALAEAAQGFAVEHYSL